MLNEVLVQLESLINQLNHSLSEEETKFGWTEEKRKIWLHYFISIKLEIECNGIQFYKQKAKSIIRSLDAYNIQNGHILETACRFENLVHDCK